MKELQKFQNSTFDELIEEDCKNCKMKQIA